MQPITVILCGGRGTRAYPHTSDLPKPLMPVNGEPILLHVMRIYAEQNYTRFILSAGYRAEKVDEFAATLPKEWDVTVIDSGEDTHKGDRVLAARDLLDDTFFVTYGDGVGDVDIAKMHAFHLANGGAATVTVVPLPTEYGTLDVDDAGRVHNFIEKPRLADHWINAGFMAMDPRVFDGWSGDLETDVLPALGAKGDLFAYRHDGFWKSMDTYKDSMDLETIARNSEAEHGRPPWLRSRVVASS